MTTPTNYYADLCTEMYEILHPTAPQDELAFYLSYAREGGPDVGAPLRERAFPRTVS